MKRKAFCLSLSILLSASAAFAQLTANPNAVDNSPKIGEMAPDFPFANGTTSIPASNLRDLIGKKRVLLMFFPGAFTPGCTTEFAEAGQNYDKFTNLNIEIIGISRDLRGAQAKFKEVVGAKNGFVSDPEMNVIFRYDAVSPNRVAKRYYFLLDDKGKIIWKNVSGTLIPTENLLQELTQVLASN